MDITYFRTRKPGPENVLEDAVVSWMGKHYSGRGHDLWAGGSVPVGGGVPDIVLARYLPQVVRFSDIPNHAIQILAYLRSVANARLDTISKRTRQPVRRVAEALDTLMQVGAVTSEGNYFAVARECRALMPEIVTVEAKVSDWRRAFAQARRNLLFSHKSFVALPERTAGRVRTNCSFRACGIGVLGIDDDNRVSVLRRGRSSTPSVWMYYYQIAVHIARDCEGEANAV